MKLVKLLFAATIGMLATADMKMSPVCIGATACAGTGVIFLGVWAAQETFDENHKNSGAVSKTAVPDSNKSEEITFGGAAGGNTKFGETCSEHDDCVTGRCGTGKLCQDVGFCVMICCRDRSAWTRSGTKPATAFPYCL